MSTEVLDGLRGKEPSIITEEGSSFITDLQAALSVIAAVSYSVCSVNADKDHGPLLNLLSSQKSVSSALAKIYDLRRVPSGIKDVIKATEGKNDIYVAVGEALGFNNTPETTSPTMEEERGSPEFVSGENWDVAPCELFLLTLCLVWLHDSVRTSKLRAAIDNQVVEEILRGPEAQLLRVKVVPAVRASSMALISRSSRAFDLLISRARYWCMIALENLNEASNNIAQEVQLICIARQSGFDHTVAAAIGASLRNAVLCSDWRTAEQLVYAEQFPQNAIRSKNYLRFLYYKALTSAVYRDNYAAAAADLKEASRRLSNRDETRGLRLAFFKLSLLIDILMGKTGANATLFLSKGLCKDAEAPENTGNVSMAVLPWLSNVESTTNRSPEPLPTALQRASDSVGGGKSMVSSFAKQIELYVDIERSVRAGNLLNFQMLSKRNDEELRRDLSFPLVARCGHAVVRSGAIKIANTYSRIPLSDVQKRLGIQSAEETANTIAQAVKVRVLRGVTLDLENGIMINSEPLRLPLAVHNERLLKRRQMLSMISDEIDGMRIDDGEVDPEEQADRKQLEAEERLQREREAADAGWAYSDFDF